MSVYATSGSNTFFEDSFIKISDAVKKIISALSGLVSQISVNSPLHTYKINTKCELSYFLLDLWFTKKEAVQDTFTVNNDEVKKRGMDLYNQYIKRLSSDPEFASNNVEQKQALLDIQLLVFDEQQTKPFMEQNSVNPKLETTVRSWLLQIAPSSPYFQDSRTAANANYNIVKLTDADNAEDPQCAEMHKKYFSNTIEWLKQNWGY